MKPNRRWMAHARKADSVWEADLRDKVLTGGVFQGAKIPYNIPHNYTPDFVFGNTLIETKGRFRDSAEAAKYKHIRDAITADGKELVFIFYKASTPMPHAKTRKDGTKQTHGEWAERNGFRYFECNKDLHINEELKKFLEEIK
ncbi:endonuclease [Vibrio phage vB_ValP_IME234]|nr:endonuclease [Vibrio phage vB_ValP_IME234]